MAQGTNELLHVGQSSFLAPVLLKMLTSHSLGHQTLCSLMYDIVLRNCDMTQPLTYSILEELFLRSCGFNSINMTNKFTGRILATYIRFWPPQKSLNNWSNVYEENHFSLCRLFESNFNGQKTLYKYRKPTPSKVIQSLSPFNPTNGVVKINMGDSNMPGSLHNRPVCKSQDIIVYHGQKMTFIWELD